MQALVNAGAIEKQLFAFWCGNNGGEKNGGELTIGGVNPKRYTGEIVWAPVIRKGYHEVKFTKMTYGDLDLNLPNMGAAIDTGTSLIALPSAQATRLNNMIGATKVGGAWTVPCSAIPDLPDVIFTLGGVEYRLRAADYILELQKDQCVSGFMGIDIPAPLGPVAIIGDAFMRACKPLFFISSLMLITPLQTILSTIWTTLVSALPKVCVIKYFAGFVVPYWSVKYKLHIVSTIEFPPAPDCIYVLVVFGNLIILICACLNLV